MKAKEVPVYCVVDKKSKHLLRVDETDDSGLKNQLLIFTNKQAAKDAIWRLAVWDQNVEHLAVIELPLRIGSGREV